VEHYIATQLQYENQANKWDSFILKMDDIVLRGTAMNAMGGLMNGISHLCNNIAAKVPFLNRDPARGRNPRTGFVGGKFREQPPEGAALAELRPYDQIGIESAADVSRIIDRCSV
jgi:hypothetical protein